MTREGIQKCGKCNEISDRLFQHNMCKNCLMKEFEKLRPFIDFYRNTDEIQKTQKSRSRQN